MTHCSSIWLVESQIPFRLHHSQAGANPELRTLFFRLAQLLQFPVILLFIFDGEERPPIKRWTLARIRWWGGWAEGEHVSHQIMDQSTN